MIDTHAHLFLSKESPSRYVESALAAGVKRIINVATDMASAKTCVELAANYPILEATVGIHPCSEGPIKCGEDIESFVSENTVVAIGEIGLDGYRSVVPMNDQICRFISQLDVARRLALPVIIHCREAAHEMIPIVRDYPDVRKVFHCFSENPDFIDAVSGTNTFFSFTGNISYRNAVNSRAAASSIPLDKIMLETDSPYMTPLQKNGLPNQSSFVGLVAKELAKIRGVSLDTVVSETTNTARLFFSLSD